MRFCAAKERREGKEGRGPSCSFMTLLRLKDRSSE